MGNTSSLFRFHKLRYADAEDVSTRCTKNILRTRERFDAVCIPVRAKPKRVTFSQTSQVWIYERP